MIFLNSFQNSYHFELIFFLSVWL